MTFSYYAKGKRSLIYKGMYKKKQAIKKVTLGKVFTTIENEKKYLTKLQPYGFTPKVYAYTENEIIMQFIKGKKIEEFLASALKQKIKHVLKEIIHQCRILDKLGIDKQEMSHPKKHILIAKSPTMIDFERSKFSLYPKNLTAFIQYLQSKKIQMLLEKKEIFLQVPKEDLQRYKRNQNNFNYEEILKNINF